jgi:hypothetical protein
LNNFHSLSAAAGVMSQPLLVCISQGAP